MPAGRPRKSSEARLYKDAIAIALSVLMQNAPQKQKFDIPWLAEVLADPSSSWQLSEDGAPRIQARHQISSELLDSRIRYTRARLNGTSSNRYGYNEEEEKFVHESSELLLVLLVCTSIFQLSVLQDALIRGLGWDPAIVNRFVEARMAVVGKMPEFHDIALGLQSLKAMVGQN